MPCLTLQCESIVSNDVTIFFILYAPNDNQVSTPSSGLGFKIAFMAYQRCKPCLCLVKRGDGVEGQAISALSPMLKEDRMLDVSTERCCLAEIECASLTREYGVFRVPGCRERCRHALKIHILEFRVGA